MQGITGSLAMYYGQYKENTSRFNPSFKIDYKRNRLNLYSSLQYSYFGHYEDDTELTQYFGNDPKEIDLKMKFSSKSNTYRGNIGSVYEISDRQNFGVDVEYMTDAPKTLTKTLSNSVTRVNDQVIEKGNVNLSNLEGDNLLNISANYRATFDSLGSSLLVAADYSRSNRDRNGITNFNSLIIESGLNTLRYEKDLMDSKNDFYTAKTDYNLYIGKRSQFQTGAKFAYANMYTDLAYLDRSDINDPWVANDKKVIGTLIKNRLLQDM